MSQTPNPYNPYAAAGVQNPSAFQPSAASEKMPTFVTVMMIIDMVFRGLRVPIALLGIVGVVVMPSDNPMFLPGIFEVITGAVMAVCGLVGDGLVLAKRRIGLIFCWVAVAATLANVVVALFELPIQAGQQPENVRMVVYAVAGIFLIFRLALIGTYGFALLLAKKYFDRHGIK